MAIIPFLILASLAMAGSALLGFIWAVKADQFEDTCTPSIRILMDEQETPVKKDVPQQEQNEIHQTE